MSWFTADRIIRFLVVALVLGLLLRAGLRGWRGGVRGPNLCPIEGHVAEWRSQRNATTCDYGHFSNIEKSAHRWSAACR
jgi:hypothetical protein